MNLNDITEKIRKLSNENSGSIEAKIKFDFNDGCVSKYMLRVEMEGLKNFRSLL